MKVLQINSVCGVGSTGRIATDLYQVLEEQGHECVIAYGRGKAPGNIKSIKIGSNIDNYIHAAKTRITDMHGFGSIRATQKFIEKVKVYNPDVIHLHNIHGYYINIEILFNYLRESNKPIIWTLHDCWTFTGHCTYFDYINCIKWKKGCDKCSQGKVYPSSLLMDFSNSNYKKKKEIFTSIKNMTIVTPSSWLKELVEQSFLAKYPVKVINNGIDLNVFKPTESDFREKHDLKCKFIILGVASEWNDRKGLKYFIKLMDEIDDSYKIVLVGVTKNQKKKLPNGIIGITKTNNMKELAEIYTQANVFVNLTLEDNFPTTNLEALACGTPVITFETGGSVESISERCGYVVEKGNVKQLIGCINLIKMDVKKDYFQHCIDRAKESYNKNNKFYEYFSIYES